MVRIDSCRAGKSYLVLYAQIWATQKKFSALPGRPMSNQGLYIHRTMGASLTYSCTSCSRASILCFSDTCFAFAGLTTRLADFFARLGLQIETALETCSREFS